jgi:hypothetical protein
VTALPFGTEIFIVKGNTIDISLYPQITFKTVSTFRNILAIIYYSLAELGGDPQMLSIVLFLVSNES